jgi:hypothetical protein
VQKENFCGYRRCSFAADVIGFVTISTTSGMVIDFYGWGEYFRCFILVFSGTFFLFWP